MHDPVKPWLDYGNTSRKGMVRLYIQLASSPDTEWNPYTTASAEEAQQIAKNIFKPYQISWDQAEWCSVYPISQGIAEKYTLDHRVFLGGDACHTFSPKAGQGTNTAFHDAINLAWKLHLFESGFAKRSILATYESERKFIAEKVFNLDAQFAGLFSQRQTSSSDVCSTYISSAATSPRQDGGEANDENEFVAIYKANCEIATGFGVAYPPNIFNPVTRSPNPNPNPSHPATAPPLFDPPGTQCYPGRIMPACTVIHVLDANVVHLENEIPFNGAFRLLIFAGKVKIHASSPTPAHSRALTNLANGLQDTRSLYTRFSSEIKAR